VAHGDHGLVWRAPSVNGLEDSLVQGARPFYQRIGVLPHSREIRWSQKWYGENPGNDCVLTVAERYDQPIHVDLTVHPWQPTNDVQRTKLVEDRSRRFQSGGRIVVATDDNDLQARGACVRPPKELVPKLRRAGRRACCIEDVSCDKQSIDGLSFERIKQPVEKDAMLILALDPMENMPKVPVAGVKNTKGHPCVVNSRGTADKEPLGLFVSLWLNLFYAH
jgi:hypothetical protein